MAMSLDQARRDVNLAVNEGRGTSCGARLSFGFASRKGST